MKMYITSLRLVASTASEITGEIIAPGTTFHGTTVGKIVKETDDTFSIYSQNENSQKEHQPFASIGNNIPVIIFWGYE